MDTGTKILDPRIQKPGSGTILTQPHKKTNYKECVFISVFPELQIYKDKLIIVQLRKEEHKDK